VTLVPDKIKVEVDGRLFDKWSSYEVRTDIFSPPSSFALEIGKVDDATLELLSEGQTVDIYVYTDGDVEHQLMRGRINQRVHAYSKGSHTLTVRGHDLAYDLMVSSAPFDLRVKDRTFAEVLAEILEPWQIPYTLSNEISRYLIANKANWKKLLGNSSRDEYYATIRTLQENFKNRSEFKTACTNLGIPVPPHIHDGIVNKAKDAKVDPGESVFDWITRITNKAEVFAWMSPDGWLTIQRPQYEQEPLYILSHRPDVPEQNNVKSASETRDIDGIPTDLSVHGRVREKGKKRQNYTARVISEAVLSIPFYDLHRPVHMKDKDARTVDEIERRAFYAMKDAEKNYRTYSYIVAGHSQERTDGQRYVWATDTVAKTVDEVFGINEMLYTSGVTYRRGRVGNSPGPQETELTLTPLDVWFPKED
jgi:prophage tail gpP-like protein